MADLDKYKIEIDQNDIGKSDVELGILYNGFYAGYPNYSTGAEK